MAKKRVPTEQEIAKKHGVDVDYVIRQAEVGSTVEREHVTDHKAAYGIALQHIAEFPDYYKHLLSMEKSLKKEWEKKKPIKENVSSGNARRARMGGIQSKPVGPISNSEVAQSQSDAKAKFAERVKAAGDAAHKAASEKGMSPSEAEMRRKAAERKASKLKENHIAINNGTEKDDEGAMALGQLDEIELYIKMLRETIKSPDYQLPGWVQAKLALATHNLNAAAMYLRSNHEESVELRSFGDFIKEAKSPAWQRSEGKNKNGGLNEKGRKSYEEDNPGSDLKAPQPEGGPRRDSFCARMRGMKEKRTNKKTANDPNSRINKSLRAWNC
jgi:Domain of unknown function (DUF6321)/Protein of unknown function (DUF5661)